jgi:type I restriction enzyme S subunit
MGTPSTNADMVPLAEVATPVSNSFVDGPFGSEMKSNEYKEGGVRLIQLQNIGDGAWIDENKKFISEEKFATLRRHGAVPGDIAIAKMADPVARSCILPPVAKQFIVVADCIKLTPDSTRYDARFVSRAINSHRTRLEAELKSSGTTRLRINLSALKTVHIWAPVIAEQRRIAAVLDTVDEAIAKTVEVIAKIKQVRAGLLHDLLTHGLDEHGQLRDPIAHPEQFKESPLGRIPRGWEVRTCQSICWEIVVGIVVKPAQYYVEEGVPALRSANVRDEGIQMTDLVFISDESNALLSKSILRTGDVVTVRTGYPGTTCVVPPVLDGSNCIDLIISRPGTEIVPEFLALWINSPFGRDQVLRVQGGLAQQHFNVGELKTLLVAKPEREEQLRIGERLRNVDLLTRAEVDMAAKLAVLKSGLMADLLTGRVRVPEVVLEETATS